MKTHRRGITLLEIMIAAALVGLVGLSFAALYGSAQRYLFQTMTMASTQGEAAFAMDHLLRHFRISNRIHVYGANGVQASFRFDPSPLPGTPGNPNDDSWGGYRLDGTGVARTLNFYPVVTVNSADPPAATAFDGVTREPVARNVLAPGQQDPDDAAVTVPDLFINVNSAMLGIDLAVRQGTGANARRSRLRTQVSPRGVQSTP